MPSRVEARAARIIVAELTALGHTVRSDAAATSDVKRQKNDAPLHRQLSSAIRPR